MTITVRPPTLLRFAQASLLDPAGIGSVVPSGSSLVRALLSPVFEQVNRPLRVLEVGAGTGPITRDLIRVLSPGSRLDVVEAHLGFLPELRALCSHHSASLEVNVHGCFVQDAVLDNDYDVCISSLPFTNMQPGVVADILTRYRALVRPGGTITWFAYLGSRRARRLTAPAGQVDRHAAVEALLASEVGSHRTVWANFPPARVTRLTVPRPA